ncbi:hypothetical protein, partial [Streptomyces sp. NPDC058964]|uniref:hypothetical protein n=1 Tax=Streptomyces sp. NPDC058964 TaxID=3346681 RepID=UPI0036CF30F8
VGCACPRGGRGPAPTPARPRGTAPAAAEHLTRGATGFGEAVQASTNTLTTGLVAAGEEAARRIVETVATTSGRFAETVARAAAGQEAQAARQAADVHAILTEGRDALTSAALELRESATGLDRSLTVLPDAIQQAAGTGADHIGLAYETAVTALAVSLQGEVRKAGEVLAAQTVDGLARQEAAHRAAHERQLASEQRLLASAADSRAVLVSLLQRIEEHITRLEELARHEETVRVRTQQDRQLRASALRKELDLLDQLRERQERLLDVWTDHRSPDAVTDTTVPDARPGRQP